MRTFEWFEQHDPGRHTLHIVPGYGHLDVFVGEHAGRDWHPIILGELAKDRMNLPAVAPDAPPEQRRTARTTSITLFTTQKWWGRFFMPFMFTPTRAAPKALEAMDRLSFISFASWSLIRELPYNGPPQTVRRLRHPHLFFEVSFNGSWAQYIDSSVRVLTTGMYTFWSSSRTLPRPAAGRPVPGVLQGPRGRHEPLLLRLSGGDGDDRALRAGAREAPGHVRPPRREPPRGPRSTPPRRRSSRTRSCTYERDRRTSPARRTR